MKRLLLLILSLCLWMLSASAEEMEEKDMKNIYLAGGCFWGIEKLMSVVPGVTDAVSGYANGSAQNPTYEQVCAGDTGFRETVRVTYRPEQVSLQALLYVYFTGIDPEQANGQGNDIGTQYLTGIYYDNDEDRPVIEAVMEAEKARHSAFYVECAPLTSFYVAEDYHQDYLDVHPNGYCHIAPSTIEKAKNLIVDPAAYAKPDDETLKSVLTPEQYAVTQNAATEAPYDNAYCQTMEEGLYVDVTTGEPMFTSADKYISSCGWPAFGKALDDNAMIASQDNTHGMRRTEVRSRVGNAHLGHVFSGDGESPTGTRYCINSASLRLIPYDAMDAEGYGEYKQYVRPLTEPR